MKKILLAVTCCIMLNSCLGTMIAGGVKMHKENKAKKEAQIKKG